MPNTELPTPYKDLFHSYSRDRGIISTEEMYLQILEQINVVQEKPFDLELQSGFTKEHVIFGAAILNTVNKQRKPDNDTLLKSCKIIAGWINSFTRSHKQELNNLRTRYLAPVKIDKTKNVQLLSEEIWALSKQEDLR